MVDLAVGIVIGAAFGKIVMVDGTPKMELQDYAILNFGPFIQTQVDLLLIAAAIFLAVKAINVAKAQFEEKQEEQANEPSEDVLLLREIRDALANRN